MADLTEKASNELVRMHCLVDSVSGKLILQTSDFHKGMKFVQALPHEVQARLSESYCFVSPDIAAAMEWPKYV